MNTLIILPLLGVLVLYLGLYKAQKILIPVVVIGLLGTLLLNLSCSTCSQGVSFYGMLEYNKYAVVFSSLCILITTFIVLLSKDYFEQISNQVAEYYALLLFALTGVVMMVSYHNLAMLFIGIETMSVCLYILAGIRKKDVLSNEASLKYFLMGVFTTGILLMGIALVYGATGSFDLTGIANYVKNGSGVYSPFLYVGLVFLLAAFSFKVGVAPFHFWTPDVYQGAPSLITSFMATVVKIAGFAAMLKLFSVCFSGLANFWGPLVFAIIVISLFVANITAVLQTDFKRTLAYSSISHAGYLLLAVLALGAHAGSAILIYAIGYAFASLIAFAGLIEVKRQGGDSSFEAFNGLSKRNPFLAFVLMIAMLSFAGIPLTAGFMGKFVMLSSAMEQYRIALLVMAIINAAIGIYYYFKLIVAMYFKSSSQDTALNVGLGYKLILAICVLITFAVGICPNWLLSLL